MEMDEIIKWHRDRQAFFSHHGEPWGAMGRDSKRIADSLEDMQKKGSESLLKLRDTGWPH